MRVILLLVLVGQAVRGPAATFIKEFRFPVDSRFLDDGVEISVRENYTHSCLSLWGQPPATAGRGPITCDIYFCKPNCDKNNYLEGNCGTDDFCCCKKKRRAENPDNDGKPGNDGSPGNDGKPDDDGSPGNDETPGNEESSGNDGKPGNRGNSVPNINVTFSALSCILITMIVKISSA